jgi:hypothetical protein
MTLAGHVAHMKNIGNAFKIIVRELDGNKPLGDGRITWKQFLQNRV